MLPYVCIYWSQAKNKRMMTSDKQLDVNIYQLDVNIYQTKFVSLLWTKVAFVYPALPGKTPGFLANDDKFVVVLVDDIVYVV